MKTLYSFSVFLLFFIPTISLSAQDSIAEDNIEKISLKINLEPNTSYRFIKNNTQKTVQRLMDVKTETNLNSTVHYLFEVESNTGKEMRIKASYERFAFTIQAPQDTINIDTDLQEEQNTSEYSSWFSSLINKPFYIVLSNQGKVLKLEGLAEVLNIPEIEQSSILEKAFSSPNFLFDIESNFYIFPEDSISLGQSWHRNENQSLSKRDLTLKKTFTLESLSEDMAWLNVEHQIENDALKAFPDAAEVNISDTLQGLIELDRNTGLILFSETQQEVEATIQTFGAFPLMITSTSTLNGEKL